MITLQNANTSGSLYSIKLGGTGTEHDVLRRSEIDAALALKANASAITNVDNTSDANKPISTATQTALDGKVDLSPDYFDYKATETFVPELEGRTYYDVATSSLTLFTKFPGVALNIPQEEVIMVSNNTGATIPNGTPVYQSGVSPGGLPQIAPALADTYDTSSVPGITTHDIASGAEGFITHAGRLRGDFSAFNIDDQLYLSDTVPGGYTTSAPDFATALGRVLSDAVDGALLVRITSHIALPTAIGWIYDLTSHTYDLVEGAAAIPLVGWNNDDAVFLTADAVAGSIDLEFTGIYDVAVTFGATFTADAKDERTFYLELFNRDNDSQFAEFGYPIPSTFNVISGTISSPIRVDAPISFGIRIRVEGDDVNGVVFSNISFSLKSVQLLGTP